MVTQVRCFSSKSKINVVKSILNYSRSVSSADGVDIQLRFQRYQPERKKNTNCITERISKVDGYTSALQFKQKYNDCCKTNTQLFQECE